MIDRLAAFVKAKRGDMSLREFAKQCDGISHTLIDNIERGCDPRTGKPVRPTVETIARIAKGTGVSVAYLAALASGEDLESTSPVVEVNKGTRIPVLGRVIAGIPIEAITEILDYEEIPETMAAQGEYFGLVAQGNSMSPTIVEGDVLIIRKQPFVENGKAAIVLVNGCEATVKRVHVTDSAVTLVADNPVAYPPHTYTKEEALCLPIKILGVVVEIRRKMI